MSKVNNVFVVASKKSSVLELTAYAAEYGEHVSLVYAGERDIAVNAEKAYYFGSIEDTSFVSYIKGMVELIQEKTPELVLVELTKNGRLAASMIAAAAGTSVLTDVSEVVAEGGKVRAKRMVYGGSAIKTEYAEGMAVVCFAPGVPKDVADEPVAEIVDINSVAAGVEMVSKACKVVQAVNLSAATKVVGVGRGFATEESLSIARDLAAVLGAEIGCTRPIAEEERWLPAARYIGVSGAMIKPAVYIAAGISGQVQHTVGVNDSGMIIAINKDEHAPIFENCDYGIIGNVETVLPLLTEKLKNG